MQSAPAILALSGQEKNSTVDLLCAQPLVGLAQCLPGIGSVIGWDGLRWHRLAQGDAVREADAELRTLMPQRYDVAYNLNQHNRAKLAAHLLADRVIGPGEQGPVSTELPGWAAYLSRVARAPGDNRVHLADTWCGFCGVRPPAQAPRLRLPDCRLPESLAEFLAGDALRIAIAVGAGERERLVPIEILADLAAEILNVRKDARVVLIGGRGEIELSVGVEERLGPVFNGRVWNGTGRTNLLQLAKMLKCCSWILAADTGPLHVATLVGAKAVGFYFARARVHETGPYGEGHWVWQADAPQEGPEVRGSRFEARTNPKPEHRTSNVERRIITPRSWPVKETAELLVTGRAMTPPAGWSLWESRQDAFGTYYQDATKADGPDRSRMKVWEDLSGSKSEMAPIVVAGAT